MSIEGEPDRDELSAMKVSELRQMCSDRGLLVSGKKDVLINRLMGVEATEAVSYTHLTLPTICSV